ncbi:MAG: mobile mystery protein B [Candidatus Kapaibacterium sp.]|jgi:Fic-DOC domain mobile mystery protein B
MGLEDGIDDGLDDRRDDGFDAGLNDEAASGQTPLTAEEKEGLLFPHVATRGELDELEQQNIENAIEWTLQRSFTADVLFNDTFIRLLHKRMFGDVWAWAGEFRTSNKNIGVDTWQISTELRTLLDDVRYWHEHSTYSPDETVLRFKHRLVSIHCFPNGNGRHSRLMADIIIDAVYKLPVFTWGSAGSAGSAGTATHTTTEDPRRAYLRAIRAADRKDYHPLLVFART